MSSAPFIYHLQAAWAGIAMLAIAFCFWLVLLGPVLGHWVTPTVGVSLVLTVSTESLAVLSATLATRAHEHWLLYSALVPFLLGLAFYVFVISRRACAGQPGARR